MIGVGRGVQHPLHLSHPGQLLVKSLPLLLRQSCVRTETTGGGGLGTGCKEDIASSVQFSSVTLEETPGGGWDGGVAGHGGGLEGDSWQAGEVGEVREMVDVMPYVGEQDEGEGRLRGRRVQIFC